MAGQDRDGLTPIYQRSRLLATPRRQAIVLDMITGLLTSWHCWRDGASATLDYDLPRKDSAPIGRTGESRGILTVKRQQQQEALTQFLPGSRRRPDAEVRSASANGTYDLYQLERACRTNNCVVTLPWRQQERNGTVRPPARSAGPDRMAPDLLLFSPQHSRIILNVNSR